MPLRPPSTAVLKTAGAFLRADSFDLLWTPSYAVPEGGHVGLSWILEERGGRRSVRHSGEGTGCRSYILLQPDDGVGLVMVSNWDRTDREAIVNGLLDVIHAAADTTRREARVGAVSGWRAT